MLSGMTTQVSCTACSDRGWKIVTRRGHVAAARFGMAESARQDCLYCEGPAALHQPEEMFEWEVFVASGAGEELGPCGSSSFQATAMDALRTAMRRLPADACVRGLITHKVYDFGMVADDWSRREIFRASLDVAGSVRFERVTS
jgi:hypothetical protein